VVAEATLLNEIVLHEIKRNRKASCIRWYGCPRLERGLILPDCYIREQDSGMANPKIYVASVNNKVEGCYIIKSLIGRVEWPIVKMIGFFMI
jgi:hypothetical protein